MQEITGVRHCFEPSAPESRTYSPEIQANVLNLSEKQKSYIFKRQSCDDLCERSVGVGRRRGAEAGDGAVRTQQPRLRLEKRTVAHSQQIARNERARHLK